MLNGLLLNIGLLTETCNLKTHFLVYVIPILATKRKISVKTDRHYGICILKMEMTAKRGYFLGLH